MYILTYNSSGAIVHRIFCAKNASIECYQLKSKSYIVQNENISIKANVFFCIQCSHMMHLELVPTEINPFLMNYYQELYPPNVDSRGASVRERLSMSPSKHYHKNVSGYGIAASDDTDYGASEYRYTINERRSGQFDSDVSYIGLQGSERDIDECSRHSGIERPPPRPQSRRPAHILGPFVTPLRAPRRRVGQIHPKQYDSCEYISL